MQPNVVVYTPQMKKLVVVIEVQPSPMSEIEKKAILGAVAYATLQKQISVKNLRILLSEIAG